MGRCSRNLRGDSRALPLTCFQPWYLLSRPADHYRVRCLLGNDARWRSWGRGVGEGSIQEVSQREGRGSLPKRYPSHGALLRGERDDSHAANTTRAGETDLGLRGATLGADVLEAMGFSPWRQVHGHASIADFFKPAGGAVSTSCASPTSNPVVLSRESQQHRVGGIE
jgi:hypothetical protein